MRGRVGWARSARRSRRRARRGRRARHRPRDRRDARAARSPARSGDQLHPIFPRRPARRDDQRRHDRPVVRRDDRRADSALAGDGRRSAAAVQPPRLGGAGTVAFAATGAGAQRDRGCAPGRRRGGCGLRARSRRSRDRVSAGGARLFERDEPRASDIVTVPGGCVVLAADGVAHRLAAAGDDELMRDATAIATAGDRVLVAGHGVARVDGIDHAVGEGATALAMVDDRTLAIGYDDGRVDFVALDGGEAPQPIGADRTRTTPVASLAALSRRQKVPQHEPRQARPRPRERRGDHDGRRHARVPVRPRQAPPARRDPGARPACRVGRAADRHAPAHHVARSLVAADRGRRPPRVDRSGVRQAARPDPRRRAAPAPRAAGHDRPAARARRRFSSPGRPLRSPVRRHGARARRPPAIFRSSRRSASARTSRRSASRRRASTSSTGGSRTR